MVVGGQVDCLLTSSVTNNPSHGLQRERLAGTDTIDLLIDERLLCVSRVARQEVVDIAIHDNHRDVPRCVAWSRHDDDCAV